MSYIFLAILITGKMHGTERTTTYLLLDDILVDGVLGSAVVLTISVFGSSIEGFLVCREYMSCMYHSVSFEKTAERRTLTGTC